MGVFALLQAYAFLQYLKDRLTRQEFQTLFLLGVSLAAGVVFLTVIYLTYTGYIAPWSGRFYSLWDTGYAKIHIPIIASVSEHQPTTWVSFFFDLHILVCTFPAGLWFCIKNINDERVFGRSTLLKALQFMRTCALGHYDIYFHLSMNWKDGQIIEWFIRSVNSRLS
ncbi:dolichyl-diphosphooligosaccharide--protein glycosyltransferase subunit STT3B-like [Notothenia coriiceps]|uniref:dolichyl-diphosphooligosaccharide--protein glycotransferase n=1 Tax=Notothenia coriiceps TaxID=8208 RepID=A0A6I9P317_9TELE|nr:PREDICTED: dolichyl-diphosphooligosaccharide--protein glycosyltransferase subunit STT3B-like [Notothenia coriiceps]